MSVVITLDGATSNYVGFPTHSEIASLDHGSAGTWDVSRSLRQLSSLFLFLLSSLPLAPSELPDCSHLFTQNFPGSRKLHTSSH